MPSASPVSVFSADHWLAHCSGFRVELDGFCVGYVEDVLDDLTGWLVVRCRSGARGLLTIEAVLAIDPGAETVHVSRFDLVASAPLVDR